MTTTKEPTPSDALIPVVSLILLLSLAVYLFGSDAVAGPTQIVLIAATVIAAIISVRNGHKWADLQEAIVVGIGTAMGAILILLAVGSLIGTWLMSGTVPSLIYYGLELLNPQFFFAACCLICSVTSLATGSSWTTAGTLGVALVGVALGLGLSPAITAGAIVSGAYFGGEVEPAGSAMLALKTTLESSFNITPWALIPLAFVLYLAVRKAPPLPTILAGALLGGLLAVALQPDVVLAFANSPDLPVVLAMTKGVWLALADGYVSTTGVEEIDELLTRGGMSSMLTTIWLILTALAFGAVMEHSGMLLRLIRSTLKAAKSTGSLVATVVMSCIGMNIVAADQYISIVLPGKMFKAEFERRNLDARNLSRILEDSGTLTSPLVPWNTCGAYMSATLGVATLAYLPFAFFNLINPLVSIVYGYTGFTIKRVEAQPAAAPAASAA